MPTSSANRVEANTSDASNARIREQFRRNVSYYASHPDRINVRLAELDREWDIERALEGTASGLITASVVWGFLRNRLCFLFAGVVSSFLLMHAVRGYCPPLPLLRRAGFRTRGEIDEEKYALKALRGDFNAVAIQPAATGNGKRADQLVEAVEK